jgi:hypothetical protein
MRREFWHRWHHERRIQLRRSQSVAAVKLGSADSGTRTESVAGQSFFDAVLKEPIRFREAISTLHDVVINDLTFKPRDKSAYEEWKKQQASAEQPFAIRPCSTARETVAAGRAPETDG